MTVDGQREFGPSREISFPPDVFQGKWGLWMRYQCRALYTAEDCARLSALGTARAWFPTVNCQPSTVNRRPSLAVAIVVVVVEVFVVVIPIVVFVFVPIFIVLVEIFLVILVVFFFGIARPALRLRRVFEV